MDRPPHTSPPVTVPPQEILGRVQWCGADLCAQRAETPETPAAQWVQLLPPGEFGGRDGRGPYHVGDPAALVAAFDQYGMPLPIDYEHQSEDAQTKTGPTPAAGWIVALEARADGIWGQVEWTEAARTMIASREYRYLSPVFWHVRETGEVSALSGAGLTNHPNLHLRALSRALHQESPMDELSERLRYLLNLPLAATPAEMVEHLQRLIDQLRGSTEAMRAAGLLGAEAATPAQVLTSAHALRTGLDALGAALEVPADATPGQVLATARSVLVDADGLHALHAAARDVLAKGIGYQPGEGQTGTLAEVAQAAVARVRALESAALDRAAADQVAAAMRDRKITPAQADWAQTYARRAPDEFAAYVAAAVPVPLAGLPREQDQPDSGDFAGLVSAAQAADPGLTRGAAMLRVARANPEAHRAWVESHQHSGR